MSPADPLPPSIAQPPLARTHAPGARRYWPLCALLGGLALTLLGYFSAESAVAHSDAQRFVQATDRLTGQLTLRLHDCEQVLAGAKSLFAASQSVERSEWTKYTAALDLTREFPGLRGLGFVRYVPRDEIGAFEVERREQGSSDFTVHPSGEDAECFVVQFIEPELLNPGELGRDLAANSIACTAAVCARDTGRAALSEPIDLPCAAGTRRGLLMFYPVFERVSGPNTPERSKALLGWVYAAIEIEALIACAVGDGERVLAYSILDGRDAGSRSLVYASDAEPLPAFADEPRDEAGSSSIARTAHLLVGTRTWLVRMHTRPAFHTESDRWTPLMTLTGGTLVTLFLWILVWSLGRSRVEALKLAQEMTDDLRQTESSLRAKKAEFEALHDASPLGMFYMGPDGDCVYTNRILQKLLGLRAEEALGNRWIQALHPEDKEKFLESWSRAVAKGSSLESFHRYVRPDGTVVWGHVNAAPVRAGERVIGYVGTVADFSARRAAEEGLVRTAQDALQARAAMEAHAVALDARTHELEDARAAAEASARSKTEFLANMSHELRTPMTAILGYTDLLLDGGQPAADRTEALQTVKKHGNHLLAIIDDILEISSVDAGRSTIQPRAVCPAHAVEEVLCLLTARAAEKQITLSARARGPLPETITSDPTRLRQILLNLVGNAIKFTEYGGVEIETGLCESEPGRLEIRIIDTGPGMSSAQVSALFQPFQQADASNSRRHGGAGLGLAMSRRLATLLGGDIRASCVPARGCTFTLTIQTGPLEGVRSVDVSATAAPAAPAPALPASPLVPLHLHGRVLLADDGRDNQRLIAAHLRKTGLQIEFADDGQIAVEKALAAVESGRPYDLILMDMQMPVLDGYGAASVLRARGYSGSIVALTARAMAGDRERCLAAGCDDYATKPIEKDVFLATCARWMKRPTISV